MVPPGFPDFFTRKRVVDAGRVTLRGRAWSGWVRSSGSRSGSTAPGPTRSSTRRRGDFAWRGWSCDWDAKPGRPRADLPRDRRRRQRPAGRAAVEPAGRGQQPRPARDRLGPIVVTDAAARRWGAQSMTAPAPRGARPPTRTPPLAPRSTIRPTASCMPVDLAAAAMRARCIRRPPRPAWASRFTRSTSRPMTPTSSTPSIRSWSPTAAPFRCDPASRTVADEPALLEAWTVAAGIPTMGRIEAPGTVEGGDTFWLRPDLLCIGRSLRTNDAGARQLADLVGGDVRIFDLPYWRGPAELVHLLSVISPVTDDLAVVYPPLLPAGLWALLDELRHPNHCRPRRRVPDARLQRAGGPTRRPDHGRGESRHPGRPRGRGLRGAHLPGRPRSASTAQAVRPA